MEGPSISRLLYGSKWAAADPLIAPGTVFAWAVSTVLIFTTVLQARNLLKFAFACGLAAAISCLPAIVVAAAGAATKSYAWVLACGQMAAAVVAAIVCSRLLPADWPLRTLIPPSVAGALAGISVSLIHSTFAGARLFVGLALETVIFGGIVAIVYRLLFQSALRQLLSRMPGSRMLMKIAGL